MSRIQMFVTNSVTHDSRVLRESAALADAGNDVEVVGVLEPGSLPFGRAGSVEIARLDREHLASRLIRRGIRARFGGERGDAGTVITSDTLTGGGRVRAAALRAALGAHLTLTWLTFARRALARGRRRPSDVVVAHDLDTLPIAAVTARLHRASLLYDSHELYVEHESEPRRARLTRNVQRLAEGRLIRLADAVITVNASIAEELQRRYGIARPTVVMNVPVATARDAEPIDLHARLELPPSTPIAVYVGGLAPGRGLEQLVASAAHLDGVAVVVIGPSAPHYRAELATLAADAGAAERVFLLDAVDAPDVTRWVAGADVGVVPYRSTCLNNYLALPNKLFEYLAAGLPVVTSDFPELRRIVNEHGVGATCDPDDPADIARAVRAVVPPAPASEETRAAAREAGRLFTWERERERLLRAFEGLGASR